MNNRIIPLLFVIAIGCGKKDKRPDGELTDEQQTTTDPAPTVHADPGPALQRRTGAREALVRPTVRASVDRFQKRDGYVLAVVPLPDPGLPTSGNMTSWTVDAGDQHGAAFRWSGPDVADETQSRAGLIVRIQGDALPQTFSVGWAQTDRSSFGANRRAGTVGTIEVTTPPNAAKVRGLDEVFWDHAATAFRQMRGTPFHAYASERARYLAHGKQTLQPGPNGQQRRSDIHRMMDLYTGMTSVDEALQHDRALLLRATDPAERTIPITDLQRLEIPPHPWDEMIAELGEEPRLEPIATSVPADMGYVHFGDMRTFVKLIRDLDDWVSPVAQWIEQRGGASHFMSRYEEQLILERTGVAETLGHVAVESVAVVASDPFLREGTDVSIVFRVANRAALMTALSAFEADARRRHSDLRRSTVELATKKVELRSTPDRVVHQYRVELGDLIVLSNSAAAISRIIEAHRGKVARLSDQGDFRYMRTVYPYSEDEDGFVFFGDAFVARVVSPEVKILEARRMEARADLQSLNYAALMRGWVDGVRTTSAAELVESGFVERRELKHSTKETIEFTERGGARSEFGSVARLAPIRELEPTLDKVTSEEKDAYDRFRQTYQTYWRTYVDPIGARLVRSEDGRRISVDARMLPLINATEYEEMMREVGLKKILAPAQSPGMEWTLAIGDDASLRRQLDGLAKGFIPGDNIGVDWLGDWASVGVADRGGLWDMALLTGMIPTTDTGQGDFRAGISVLSSFPLYAAVDVQSQIGLAALLTGLKKWVTDAAPGMLTWGQSEPYREVPIVTVAASQQADEDLRDATIHYATVKGVFVISFNRPTLLTLIDRYLAGDGPVAPTGPPSATADEDAQAVFSLDRGPNGWMTKTVMAIAEREIIAVHSQVMEAVEVLWRGLGAGALAPDELRELGVAYLGYEPRSPHGGQFSVVDRFPTHSIYGDSVRPIMPDVPVPDSPITDLLNRVERLRMSIEFDGEGAHRGLHSMVSWTWDAR